MNSSTTVGPSVSLALACTTDNKSKAAGPFIHRPGDLIPASIELHKHRAFEALSLHGSLVGRSAQLLQVPKRELTISPGETRVWTHPAGREDIYQTMIHTHLNQNVGFSHAVPSLYNTSVGKTMILPATFVMPELSPEGTGTSSNSRMPPSCETGSLYIDPWGRTYMQPLIEYSLQVTLRFCVPGETAIRIISAKHKIDVTTAPHCDPPMYSQSIPETKAVAASVDVRRSRFAKPFARLDISMAEPAPVVGNGVGGRCRTTGRLQLTWETSSKAYDEFELGKVPFKIEYWLQARTRYGTHLGSKDTSDEARPNKRVETTLLGTFEVRSMDRNNVRLSGANGQRCHAGTISIPIQVPDDTTPTFSHGLASRDYVLLVEVEVQGLQHKALSVRVPVQVCESVVERKFDDSQAKSSIYGDMLLLEVSYLHRKAIADYALARQLILSRCCRGTKTINTARFSEMVKHV